MISCFKSCKRIINWKKLHVYYWHHANLIWHILLLVSFVANSVWQWVMVKHNFILVRWWKYVLSKQNWVSLIWNGVMCHSRSCFWNFNHESRSPCFSIFWIYFLFSAINVLAVFIFNGLCRFSFVARRMGGRLSCASWSQIGI